MPVRTIARSARRASLALSLCAAAPAIIVAQSAGPATAPPAAPAASFTLQQVLSYPYPSTLVAAPTGARIAWVANEQGRRNVWFAEGPEWKAKRLTSYATDDGQELTNLAFTPDGNTVVYVRGGDHDANWDVPGDIAPDPTSSPEQPKVEIWAVSTSGGAPKMLAQGDMPAVSPEGDRLVFTRDKALWVVSADGSAPAKRLIFERGTSAEPVWSPDGSKLAFVSDRGDHGFIGVFTNDSTPITWIAPSTSYDDLPRWSPDGKRLAFVRRPGQGGAPQSLLQQHPQPWSIWVADATTGAGRRVWQSPNTLNGSYPTTDGEANLAWGAGDRLVFLADLDGWPHLYSIPAAGGKPTLLTPGRFMTEFITLSPDRSFLVYGANTGPDANDDDRRHIFRVPVDRASPALLTPGEGVEWTPVVTGDGKSIAFIGAGAKTPPLPMVLARDGGAPRPIGAELVPADFPSAQLVAPRKVTFRAADGTLVHGQLFARPATGKRPGIIFVHGGPPRQMLLGWHYMDYYSNAYAVNQYLASRGYAVLSVNYRLGIGYGHAFHHPAHAGWRGASEYQDVKAGALYLRGLPDVDATRIGIWGGSYGGYLTALALARNSDIFKTGVDFHGVHDWTSDIGDYFARRRDRYEQGDLKAALDVAWRSSPVSSMATWRSPVLLVQGDDDRNVHFHQTVDLARRLAERDVRFEEMVLPDEIHGFLRHASWLTADRATAEWFDRLFGAESTARR